MSLSKRDAIAQAFGWRDWKHVIQDSQRDGYTEAGGRGPLAAAIGRTRREAEDLIEHVDRYVSTTDEVSVRSSYTSASEKERAKIVQWLRLPDLGESRETRAAVNEYANLIERGAHENVPMGPITPLGVEMCSLKPLSDPLESCTKAKHSLSEPCSFQSPDKEPSEFKVGQEVYVLARITAEDQGDFAVNVVDLDGQWRGCAFQWVKPSNLRAK